jgi:putative transposase
MGVDPMSGNVYSEINLHITWHTKGSAPLLEPKIEAIVHHYLRGKCINTEGVYYHEVNGTETHVHLCVTVLPKIHIDEFIGQLKGGSSHEVNLKLGRKVLEWQQGYGVVSFGAKDLEWVKAYVRDQKQRHEAGRAVQRLERITSMDEWLKPNIEKPGEPGYVESINPPSVDPP